MDETFDPYLKWLGIRSAERPPNHYALLGLSLFEDDPEVVANAADRQMSHVRTFQVGPHSPWSQRLLNELAAAKLCLLRADRKATYDAQLGKQFAAAEAEAAAQLAATQQHAGPVDEPYASEQVPVATPVPTPVAAPVAVPFTTNYIEPPVDYTAPPQPPLPAAWHTATDSPVADEAGAMPASGLLPDQTSGSFEYAAPAVDAYAEGVGWTEPIAYEPAYPVDPPAYGETPIEPPYANTPFVTSGMPGDTRHDSLAAFPTAVSALSSTARARITRRRSSSPMGIYVVLAGLLLTAVVLGKVVSDQRQAYEQEVAAQRAQEEAQRAAAAAKPPSPNKWKRPPNRSRSVDARLPRPSHGSGSEAPADDETAQEDRVPLREAGEPTSFDDPLIKEAERDRDRP